MVSLPAPVEGGGVDPGCCCRRRPATRLSARLSNTTTLPEAERLGSVAACVRAAGDKADAPVRKVHFGDLAEAATGEAEVGRGGVEGHLAAVARKGRVLATLVAGGAGRAGRVGDQGGDTGRNIDQFDLVRPVVAPAPSVPRRRRACHRRTARPRRWRRDRPKAGPRFPACTSATEANTGVAVSGRVPAAVIGHIASVGRHAECLLVAGRHEGDGIGGG